MSGIEDKVLSMYASQMDRVYDDFINNAYKILQDRHIAYVGLLLTLKLKNISFYLPGFDIRNTPRELNPQIMGIKYVYM